ncbi:hypothetical protein SeMB42_g06370 [Synchytrium endobioticum]|uniref:RING-type E3 ubiquitin transferase n=1 Tax=Synchytrium endobioticum TaxID=286115 RepID=A0A507CLB6_9FUNG|nr:hypothetical protein SeMB42_g06370 [Synchytrium endobioticum]TPX40720.1 hypothetical protein SeLEV6574_g06451 [Synchytrium endobioticum]
MLPGAWSFESRSRGPTTSTTTSPRSSASSSAATSTQQDSADSNSDNRPIPASNIPSSLSSSSSYSYSSNDLRRRHVPQKEVVGRSKGKSSWWSSLAGSSSSSSSASSSSKDNGPSEGLFECHICMDTASNPVVTMCGHLFCWPCLHKWMISGNTSSGTCPVCKSLISKEKCIPIYAHGREMKDPRKNIPERPQGQREEAPSPSHQQPRPLGTGILGSNTHLSFGFGPLGMFGMQFDLGNTPLGNNPRQSTEEANQQFMMKILVFVVFLVLWACLLP